MRRFRPIKRLRDFFYWLKCRLWHRYNVVVCESLPPTWNDRDQVMLHAAFQCLVDFIEKEQPWEFTGDVYEAYKEPPSTKTCMERAGMAGEVAHTAVEDAVAVIKMIRHYYAGRFAA